MNSIQNIQQSEDIEKFLEDVGRLVAIPSVRDMETASAKAPFGKEIRKAFDAFMEIAQRMGFTVRDFDGYALDAQIGEGDDYIGVLGHLDVVEAGERSLWNSDPFVMRQENGMLYGRGVNDDKGPLLAALYAAARIKKEKRKLHHPIRIIAGGAEETTWECMEHYFKHAVQPVCGFSPDGNFPIVNGEKGILQVRFLMQADKDIRLYCKERLNIVCDDIQMLLPKGSDISFVERTNLIEVLPDGIRITYRGIRALSRNPQRGENAIYKLVKDFHGHLDRNTSLYAMVNMLYENFTDDFYGKKSGLYFEDEAMGCGSVCPMSMQTHDGMLELCLDVRYVKATNEQELLSVLRTLALQYGCDLEVLRHKRLLYVEENSTLIQSLKTAYRRVMDEEAAVFTKGGASYARVLDHGVAFGATFPDEDPRPHMPNECMPVESLLKASDIYYEALVELACIKR